MDESTKRNSAELTYKEYIEGLSKKELQHLILGSDGVPPILTRDEPLYSRPQLIWSIMKIKKISLEQAENLVTEIINEIHQHKWDIIFNYDYVRFDLKKPGFWYFISINFLGLLGLFFILRFFFNIIAPIFLWILK